MAVWTKEGKLIINGIDHPSQTTRRQQSELRHAAQLHNVPRCLIPFPALREAGFYDHEILDIKIVATTADREETRWSPCQHKRCIERGHPEQESHRIVKGIVQSSSVVHFLGETLFQLKGNLYVCGLDRNDDPNKRSFYLTQLPKGTKAKTVDEALLKLRPKNLPEDTLRQGEWFLVPSEIRPPKKMQIREYTRSNQVRTGIPVISDKPEAISNELTNSYTPFSRRETRHVATRMFLNGAVFVSGCLRDEQHGRLKLGNGKQWFKVVKNLAVGGWTTGNKGTQVD
jgi:hypothetical protein